MPLILSALMSKVRERQMELNPYLQLYNIIHTVPFEVVYVLTFEIRKGLLDLYLIFVDVFPSFILTMANCLYWQDLKSQPKFMTYYKLGFQLLQT